MEEMQVMPLTILEEEEDIRLEVVEEHLIDQDLVRVVMVDLVLL
tara:strand:- start:64 stop:195 length:132 start_codon:yes stop_codon:yes gene_type:complete